MHIIVMGVSGSGKSTVGEKLAAALNLPFLEGDSLHPKANVDKMASGIPLQDEDRWPWLDKIGERLATVESGIIVSCSSLKRAIATACAMHHVAHCCSCSSMEASMCCMSIWATVPGILCR